MLIGIYGIILEFFNPGAVAPGLIGIISLLVALYALAFIPINYAGAALVLLGIGLMVAEAHIGAFGALGVGGIAAFVIGALMMFPARGAGFRSPPASSSAPPSPAPRLSCWCSRRCCARASGRSSPAARR